MGTIILGKGLAQALVLTVHSTIVPSDSSYQLGVAWSKFLGTNKMR
jgi:hypothetical protein